MKGSGKKKLKSCEAKQLQVTLVLLTSKTKTKAVLLGKGGREGGSVFVCFVCCSFFVIMK